MKLLLIVAVLLPVGCQKQFGDDSRSDVDKSSAASDNPDADTLAINPLAQAYPQGLRMGVLSNENSSNSAVTTGALEIDSTSLTLELVDPIRPRSFELFQLATPESLLGYDRPACETYHGTLSDNDKNTCACSHRGSRENAPGGPDEDKGKDGSSGPSEDDILSALFGAQGSRTKESEERLRGDGECFSEEISNITQAVLQASTGEGLYTVYCYEFDWGIEHGYRVDEEENILPAREPCLVAFTRSEVADAQAYIEFATQMTQAMLCQAKQSELAADLEPGQSVDLSDVLVAFDQTIDPVAGKIARLEDKDGARVYLTDYTMNVSSPQSDESLAFEFHILHSPKDSNAEYKGILWFEHALPDRPEDSSSKFKALSISYSSDIESEGAPRLVNLELRMGEFKEGRDPFVDGEVDFNTGANNDGSFSLQGPPPAGSMNQNLSNMKRVLYYGYPSEGVFNFIYGRSPGETYDENGRGFVLNTHRTSENTIKGCGYAGASAAADVASSEGISVRKSIKEGLTLEPKGFLRPFLCPYSPAGDKNHPDYRDRRFGNKIWKQCFVQNSDGSYSIDKDAPGINGQEFVFAPGENVGDYVKPPAPPRPPPPPPKT